MITKREKSGGAYGSDGGHGGFHQAGSFSAAARELELCQASVTKQIKELESWLGARLLDRTTRRLSLTEVGTGFYERSVRILDAVEEARSAAGGSGVAMQPRCVRRHLQ